ncbi:cation:proton antiporter [Jatrophihabitans sp. YIM 134969]
MTETLVVIVCGLAVIAAAAVFGPRLGIAAPLVLVAIGVGASFLPAFASVQIEPDWILEGILPPLLYSSAVSMPSMNFRREFGAISGLSVLLVVASALLLGLFFAVAVPGLGFPWGVALGAIVSPTDAVATSIVKQTSVSKRVVAILDGESLLNDATALVLLRTAIAATALSFSFWDTIGTFAYSVAVAAVVGVVVGMLNLAIRKRVSDPTVNTIISFAVPFAASVPVGLLSASGLVAAVVAGLVTGYGAPRDLSPGHRLSDTQNWRTVELVLEGAVFLTMGVQIKSIVTAVQRDHAGVGSALLVAVVALVLTVVVRAAFVAPLLGVLARRGRRRQQFQPRVREMKDRMETPEGREQTFREVSHRRRRASERTLDRFALRVTRLVADIDYFVRAPLGWRDGVAVVWAGMRGAVTVAAAQTLPEDTPQRSVLVLVAFTVAILSLLVQGATIGPLLARITRGVDPTIAQEQTRAERDAVFALMRSSGESVPEPPHPEGEPTTETFESAKAHRLAVIAAQRAALLDARDDGVFDADVLAVALGNLDASQLDLEMRGRLVS